MTPNSGKRAFSCTQAREESCHPNFGPITSNKENPENDFKELNTFYKHKEIHKYTWKCQGRGLKSIIDYLMVRDEMKRNVNDLKVVR